MSIYSCKVWGWQPYQNLRTDQSTNSTSTSANPEFLIDVFATYVTVDDADPSIFTSLHRRNFQFMAQRQVLIDNATSWSTISGMLSHMLVPFHAQPSMIQKISTSAASSCAATRVLRRASIEGYCAICLEEILLECEASRLPCLHFYHERCILRWLEKSNVCPLCRFELHLD
ncbi:E3 ubiquitin-protein ligase RING1-like protein [Morus notabilis]|uniref:RING-type E3 ubiquitin transferase n=1 Tax=Morus notabilis TaxID=981085 RepID=W9S9G0_9ROSA|nr:E3 ubiquitin-protein ligase RNF181 [Morus notabilis]EXC32248.1 E3 ubiquitin-protein ligase RING1-like protein [Morus notabilis]